MPRIYELYVRSARSLAGSATPPFYCYMKAQSGPPSFGQHAGSSSEDEAEESTNVPPCCNEKLVSQPRPIPRPVSEMLEQQF